MFLEHKTDFLKLWQINHLSFHAFWVKTNLIQNMESNECCNKLVYTKKIMLKKLLIEKSCYSRSRIKWSRTIKRMCEKRREEEGLCVCWELFPATPADLYCRQQSMVRSVAAQSAVAAPHHTDPSLSPESLLCGSFSIHHTTNALQCVSVFFRGDIDICLLKSRYLLLFYKRIIKTDLTQNLFTKIRNSSLFGKQF